MDKFGGNQLRHFNLTEPKNIFADEQYVYYSLAATSGELLTIGHLTSFTLFLFRVSDHAEVRLLPDGKKLAVGSVVQVEGQSCRFQVEGGEAFFLIAGVRDSSSDLEPGVTVTEYANVKKVAKPWGHELWLNGEHPDYAFKEIALNEGFKTSLQYHNFKRETNMLFHGEAQLHFKKNSEVENDCVTQEDLEQVSFRPVSAVDVTPRVLHRIEAMTDILLYEVSTPHLDDVIRVTDDMNRLNGRIAAEHVV